MTKNSDLFDKEIKKLYHLSRIGAQEMKRYYLVQLIIDVVISILGFMIYVFPHVSSVNASVVFYTLMVVYAGLELIEYLACENHEEALYLFFAAGVSAFSGFFLKDYDVNMVLSITLVVWTLMVAIIKIISLEKIYVKKTNLFTIKLTATSIIILIGILVAVNIFFKISIIGYMLALLYISYGVLEFICDFLDFLSNDPKFLKE